MQADAGEEVLQLGVIDIGIDDSVIACVIIAVVNQVFAITVLGINIQETVRRTPLKCVGSGGFQQGIAFLIGILVGVICVVTELGKAGAHRLGGVGQTMAPRVPLPAETERGK